MVFLKHAGFFTKKRKEGYKHLYYTDNREGESIKNIVNAKKAIILRIVLFAVILIFGNMNTAPVLAIDDIVEDIISESEQSSEEYILKQENIMEDSETGSNIDTVENNETEIEPPNESIRHYLEWTFNTYAEPDFKSEIKESYPPQHITIIEWREDGWALINTYKGAYWAYLKENKVYVDIPLLIYDDKEEKNSVGLISPQVVKVIKQDEKWLLIETWKGAKWINLAAIRQSVLLDVPSYNQRNLGYPTGCEIVSTAMMINYSTEVSVKTLVSEMPFSQNPNNGFRGNPATRNGFTIYPQALLSLTEKYLGSSQDMSGCEIKDLKEKLNANIPIVAWVNGLGFNVHAICLTGYDEKGFYYNDPWTGKKNSFITYDSFYIIWNKPINDRIYGNSYPTRKALSYNP